MLQTGFGDLYNKLKIPVIACLDEPKLPVVFANASARLLVNPSLPLEQDGGDTQLGLLRDVLRFYSRVEYSAFVQSLTGAGVVEDMDVGILSYQGDVVQARLNANVATVDGVRYYVIYITDTPSLRRSQSGCFRGGEYMTRILQASHNIADVDNAIKAILGLAGTYANVSRVYIFEDVSGSATRNTYEWCAEGIEPVIQNLQYLEKRDYNYDAIMNSAGMLVTDDTNLLPANDREILQSQGIKAVAILPLYHINDPLGYIGFDDCVSNRRWSMEEIQFLENVASVVASLINRRNVERESRRSREIVQTVTDNLDDLVYISDLDTYELKFISKSLARAVNLPPEQILGQPCWKILHRNQNGPCAFCPIPGLREKGIDPDAGPYMWELHNSVTGKWYLVKDILVNWIDDKPVHLGTYVDITYRKQYEEQLKRFAATDAMTDVFNRKWGYGKMRELFEAGEEARKQKTLCFIDLDGLKKVNDTYGHAAGDEMIVNTVRTVFSCVRKNDFISRWGGDEFILFLFCGPEDAERVMDKILFAIDHFNQTAGKPYKLSISYGLIDFSAPAESLDELVAEADRRMYRRKSEKAG